MCYHMSFCSSCFSTAISFRYVLDFSNDFCFCFMSNNKYYLMGSRTIASEERCPPPHLTPKLTLSQTLILTKGQFSLGTIVWFPLIPKINPDLDPNSNPNRGNCPNTYLMLLTFRRYIFCL